MVKQLLLHWMLVRWPLMYGNDLLINTAYQRRAGHLPGLFFIPSKPYLNPVMNKWTRQLCLASVIVLSVSLAVAQEKRTGGLCKPLYRGQHQCKKCR